MAKKQLWLSVFETLSGNAWPPVISDMGLRVSLTEADTLQACDQSAPFRTSPVFAVSSEFSVHRNLENGVWYLHFFCFDPAFNAIARIIDSNDGHLVDGMLFTLGLSSVLICSRSSEIASDVKRLTGASPVTMEVWTVDSARITNATFEISPAVDFDVARIRVQRYDSLSLAPRTVIDEFIASMGLLVPKVALHMRGELETFVQLLKLVDELVIEMVYAANPIGQPPDTLGEYSEDDFKRDRSLCETVIHQNTDRLVQINAALAYLATQALSGAAPILERRSLIRRYSLLGVGTAILALTRVARAIERGFAAGAIETILGDRADDALALPGLDALPSYDARDWASHSVNRWEGRVDPRPSYPKLPYFSGRLGFKETEYTISAAIQSLAAGAGPEWSLLTMTHEMVHGHVRNIMSLVFQGDPNEIPDTKWEEFYDRFQARMLASQRPKESLLDSIRAVFLGYSCLAVTHGSLTREPGGKPDPQSREVRFEFHLPRPDALWSVFEGEIRNISEVLVHVLDLHYFYKSSLTAYVAMIWRSWSKLPQVRGDLRQYLLRSLLVIATKANGNPTERFRTSKARLIEILDKTAPGAHTGGATIRAAKDILGSQGDADPLFYPFRAALILVDVADKVLLSNAIRAALHDADPNLTLRTHEESFEEWLEYSLSDDFSDDVVIAPAAYLADRIARRLDLPEGDQLESDTVKMFIACCSHIAMGVSHE